MCLSLLEYCHFYGEGLQIVHQSIPYKGKVWCNVFRKFLFSFCSLGWQMVHLNEWMATWILSFYFQQESLFLKANRPLASWCPFSSPSQLEGGGGVPGPSYPGPSSSPSQLVLPGWRGVPRPSFPGPYSSLPSWSFLGLPRPSFPGPSSSPSQLVLPGGGVPGPVTYPIMHLMLPVCSPDTNWWV